MRLLLLKAITIFSTQPPQGAHTTWPTQTELLKNGIATHRTVPGLVIEAQYQHGPYYLLATHWDCPFEEAHYFLLLSTNLTLISKKYLGFAYHSIWIERHHAVAENAVLFHCNHALEVRITIRKKRFLGITSLLGMKITQANNANTRP